MDDEWQIEPELPPITRRAPETESRRVVLTALDSQEPRSRIVPDKDEARRVGRRLRNAARKIGVAVTVRNEPQDDGTVKVVFTATRPTDG